MATYSEIQAWVKATHGFVPKTCWIADIKDQHGLKMREAANRQSAARKYPCPPEKRAAIETAMRHFGMLR